MCYHNKLRTKYDNNTEKSKYFREKMKKAKKKYKKFRNIKNNYFS